MRKDFPHARNLPHPTRSRFSRCAAAFRRRSRVPALSSRPRSFPRHARFLPPARGRPRLRCRKSSIGPRSPRAPSSPPSATASPATPREPVRNTPPANRMLVPRFAVAFWKARYFKRAAFEPNATRSAQWNRGAYLTEALAHCSACHTPRNALGAEKREHYMTGGEAGGWHAPALNASSPSPVPWNEESLALYLRTGLVDSHAITAGPMAPVVHNL